MIVLFLNDYMLNDEFVKDPENEKDVRHFIRKGKLTLYFAALANAWFFSWIKSFIFSFKYLQ